MVERNDRKSMAMIISAMLIFGTIGVFRKYIPLSSVFLATYRGLAGTIFLLLLVLILRRNVVKGLSGRQWILLIVSGIMIGVNWILLFEAYNYTSVATATLCYYMEPTIVILLAPIFFREILTARKIICATIAIIGMILVSGVSFATPLMAAEFKGVLFGLGAASLYAVVVMLNKGLKGIDPYGKTIIQLFAASVSLIPYLLLTWEPLDFTFSPMIVVLLLFVGFVHTGLAYALYFGSMDGLKVQTCAIVSYIDPVFAVVLSALFLKEPMSVNAVIGAVLILGAALTSEL